MDASAVVEAFQEWHYAKQELMKCYASCDTSPDYFCWHKSKAEEAARIKIGEALEAFVDARIEEKTGAC